MRTHRFFTTDRLEENGAITLTGSEHHHLKNVLRLQEGEKTTLIDGKGGEAYARIEKISRSGTDLLVEKLTQHERPWHSHTLSLALIRPAKLELALEKATELGIDHFQLFPADFSETKKISIDRLTATLHSACKQSGRFFLPTLELIDRLTLPNHPFFYGSVDPKASPLKKAPQTLTFFIGPEGGFSEKELDLLGTGTGVRLGPHILRAETAAVAAATILAMDLPSRI